jgi:antitoxin (DNA-binding transcriptional repressor) of toxin-antitoxin stability system
MKKASITEARNNLSGLIDGLKNGSAVLIMDRGRPVARLEPVTGDDSDHDESLAQLVRDGLVRPQRKPLARSFLRTDPPAIAVSAVDMLIAERREGR